MSLRRWTIYTCIYCVPVTDLRQLDSIHNAGIRQALGAFCTSPVSSMYTEANGAPLEEGRLKLSMHYHLKTRACTDNPVHHAQHEFDPTTRDLYFPRPNGRGGMARLPTQPNPMFKLEEAMTSTKIDIDNWSAPWEHQIFRLERTNTIQKTQPHLREWVNLWSLERRPKPNSESIMILKDHMMKSALTDLRLTRGWGQRQSSIAISKWWDDMSPTVQKTPGQQHRLCCWGYSHYPGTGLISAHGSCKAWYCILLRIDILLSGDWGWRCTKPSHLSYHEHPMGIERQSHMYQLLLGAKPLWHSG